MADNELKPGDPAPDFTAETQGGGTISLADHRGSPVVLYFYPKDDTPGCTKEACGFRDAHPALEKAGATVIGVSRDSVKSHDRFTTKYELNFPLASDPDETICRAYGVIRMKKMYGREVLGIERSTFLVDADGKIARAWRKVKVDGHVDEVVAALRELP